MSDRNDILSQILDWANFNEINLDRAEIQPSRTRYDYNLHKTIMQPTVTFTHSHENRANMQAVKRVVDLAPERPAPPVEALVGEVQLPACKLRVVYEGAYECVSLGYDCKPAKWSDEQAEEDAETVE